MSNPNNQQTSSHNNTTSNGFLIHEAMPNSKGNNPKLSRYKNNGTELWIHRKVTTPQIFCEITEYLEYLRAVDKDLKPRDPNNLTMTIFNSNHYKTTTPSTSERIQRIGTMLTDIIPTMFMHYRANISGIDLFGNDSTPIIGLALDDPTLKGEISQVDQTLTSAGIYRPDVKFLPKRPHISIAKTNSREEADKIVRVLSSRIPYELDLQPASF